MVKSLYLEDVHKGLYLIDLNKPCDFICDIDGTVADLTHRQVYVQSKPKNWKAFEKSMHLDSPINDIIFKVRELLCNDFNVIFCSGRGSHKREVTEEWLDTYVGISGPLYMRTHKDYRKDSIIKSELYNKILTDGYKPKFVLDDRNQVVEMWRERGLDCIQVAYGDF